MAIAAEFWIPPHVLNTLSWSHVTLLNLSQSELLHFRYCWYDLLQYTGSVSCTKSLPNKLWKLAWKAKSFSGNTSVNWILFTRRQARFYFFLKLVIRKKNHLKKSILSFATTWTALEIISLSEINQAQKHNLLVFSIICGVQSVVLTKDIECSYQTLSEVKKDGSMHTNLQLDSKKLSYFWTTGV